MINILIFESGRSGYGGSFRSCYYNAKILKKNGFCPYIVSANNSIYWNKLTDIGINVRIIPHRFYNTRESTFLYNKKLKSFYRKFSKRFPKFIPFLNTLLHLNFINKVKKIIASEKINLIHTNTNFFDDLILFKIAVDLNIPAVCHLRTIPKRPLFQHEKKLIQYNHSCFIAISDAVLKEWVKAGIPEGIIRLIYNSLPEIKQIASTSNNIPSNKTKIKILFVGRLEKQKGVDILVQALSSLSNKNWGLSIVGAGPEFSKLAELVKEKKLTKKINFYGFQSCVEKFYKTHDILVVPSIMEPFGRVIIEGMQYGIPVIGSNTGGIPEIIENGENGILFKSEDIKSLSAAIKNLIDNSYIRTLIGKNGQKKVKDFFSEDYFFEKLFKIYYELLKFDP